MSVETKVMFFRDIPWLCGAPFHVHAFIPPPATGMCMWLDDDCNHMLLNIAYSANVYI